MSASPPTTTSPPSTTSTSPPRTLRIGTRSSALALAQVQLFTTLLSTQHPTLPTTTHALSTSLGDTNKVTDLHTLASTGKSLWTEDLEAELAAGRVDIIVHSMKDVPTLLPRGMVVCAVGAREESRDAVVLRLGVEAQGKRGLGDLERGSVVGTSSVRRAAMVRRRYPGLVIRDVRGNVGTRLRKLDEGTGADGTGYDALVLAGAGVQRLGLGGRVSSWLGREEGVLHAVGQGALGVEWRGGDEWVEGLVKSVCGGKGARRVRWEVVAERGLLRALEGGCSVPVGVECWWKDADGNQSSEDSESKTEADDPPLTEIQNDGYEADDALPPTASDHAYGGTLNMRAMVVSLDGQRCVEGFQQHPVSSDAEAEECAWRMYRELVEKGAEEILKGIRLNRGMIEGQGGA